MASWCGFGNVLVGFKDCDILLSNCTAVPFSQCVMTCVRHVISVPFSDVWILVGFVHEQISNNAGVLLLLVDLLLLPCNSLKRRLWYCMFFLAIHVTQ